ncbi:pyrimidine 5'-nucleotidase [Pusillimonas sp. ANT_WB101]|uniref:pyrimidine 5'-nucleotidase n=1 Tax=Pusillimonas sp. ANT_WB101 TaxID=2597356 RepID=UPI0011ED57B3|nr:pyrimidine 5'-nucleotidase [Pusillimonas sp. ANT_WB101]
MPTLRVPRRLHRMPAAVGSHAPIWLFDLDNTLHDASKGIFGAIDGAMSHTVAAMLDVDADTADRLRKEYWKRYGATVIGMVRHHDVKASVFLERTHDFDVAALVHSENGLKRKLACLPGRKILLTNAPLDYAWRVLKALGIARHFECVWSIDHMALQGRLRPKPSAALMRQILAKIGAPAQQVVLVEDTLRNLRSARQVGMRTVHVFHAGTPFSAPYNGRSQYVDVRVTSVGQLLSGQGGHRIRRMMGHV